ncbi:MAG: hypothetical protein HKN48_13045 [Flavobacteriaceae bacterium]|nr:hypothetical protein [Flavobacteriaceae bacterium]
MKKMLLFILFVPLVVSCQNFGKLEVVADLPGTLKEVSGIEFYPNTTVVWTLNDSRNPPELYAFDLNTHKIEKTIRLKGASNIDWEDLTKNPDGTLYVGDFGNNRSSRTDLTIYHLANPNTVEKRRNEPKVTTFRYHDQINFPPEEKDKCYDVESFIYLNEHFYLFTRNRAKKYDGTTKIYKLPALEGEQVATFIGEIETCEDQSDCEITSAAISEEGKIALLSYNKVWLISEYTDDNFISGKIEKIELEHSSQKESICFINENRLFIADERSHGEGRNLYVLDLTKD